MSDQPEVVPAATAAYDELRRRARRARIPVASLQMSAGLKQHEIDAELRQRLEQVLLVVAELNAILLGAPVGTYIDEYIHTVQSQLHDMYAAADDLWQSLDPKADPTSLSLGGQLLRLQHDGVELKKAKVTFGSEE